MRKSLSSDWISFCDGTSRFGMFAGLIPGFTRSWLPGRHRLSTAHAGISSDLPTPLYTPRKLSPKFLLHLFAGV